MLRVSPLPDHPRLSSEPQNEILDVVEDHFRKKILDRVHHRTQLTSNCVPTAGILFDMDGTLVDSITAVEAAWSSVANELGMPADEVIAATHGRRAIDNLRDLKPKLRRLTNEQMDEHVQEVSRILSVSILHRRELSNPVYRCVFDGGRNWKLMI